MVSRKTPQRRVFEVVNVLIMIALVIVTFYPMIYILMASFSEPLKFLSHSGVLWKPVGGFTLIAYEKALQHPLILSGYLNTLFVVGVGTVLNIILTSIAAYFLSRENVLWQRPIAFLIIFTMYFSGGLVPLYFTVKGFGLYNSLWALILPVLINTFNLMIMRTGFASVPISLEESARIDGAGHFIILFRIVLPLAMPTVAVMILYYGVYHWNSWFNASLFIESANLKPLQLVLREILLQNNTESMITGVDAGSQMAVSETIKYAIIVIATLPILCIYPFLQKYFVKGVMIGAVKG